MIRNLTILLLAIFTAVSVSQTVNAQIFDTIKKIKREVEKSSKKTKDETPKSNEAPGSEDNQTNDGDSDSEKESNGKKLDNTKIIFSATPFDVGDTKSKQTEFTFGQPIYGRVFVPYSYSEIFTEKELKEGREFQIYVKAVQNNDDDDVITYATAFRKVYPHEVTSKFFDFVFNPDAKAVADYPIQSDLRDTFSGIFTNARYAGKKVKMIVRITLPDQNGDQGETVSSDFWVDYSKASRKTLLEAEDVSEENRKAAEKNVVAYQAKIAGASVKNSALPLFFTKAPQNAPGYSGTSNAEIIQMIKRAFGVAQVYLFRFEDNGAKEYGVITNNLGIPTKMEGYHHFYFIYQDPNDKNCKVGGGHLVKNYIGGGNYAPPRLAWSNFRPEKSESFPKDSDNRFIVDCSKVK